MEKPFCSACGKRSRAVNYIKDDVTHYRSMCMHCLRKGKKAKPKMFAWAKAGYRKKDRCERCGFKAVVEEQLFVHHADGNRRNVEHHNLATVCANCSIELERKGLGWAPSDLTPDF